MGFYSFISNDIIDKIDIEKIVKQAKIDKLHEAAKKLGEYEPVNEEFFEAAMPVDTPKIVNKKRVKKVNKLKMMCMEKRMKKMLG